MIKVFVEQAYKRSLDGWIDCRHLEETVTCLDIHSVHFVGTAISEERDRVICEFLAPDIESVRHALRDSGNVSASIIGEAQKAAGQLIQRQVI